MLPESELIPYGSSELLPGPWLYFHLTLMTKSLVLVDP